MKTIKITVLLFFILPMLIVSSYAQEDYRSEKGPLARVLTVEGRGILNLATCPLELFWTAGREVKKHPKAWPITYLPRLATNLTTRIMSGVSDIFFQPFVAPFTNDIRPWTEPLGLPDYVWQETKETF